MNIKSKAIAIIICLFLIFPIPLSVGAADETEPYGETETEISDTTGEIETAPPEDADDTEKTGTDGESTEAVTENAKTRNEEKRISEEKTADTAAVTGEADADISGHPTGAGLTEWSLRAVNEKWDYVWGGATPGAVDCSGLICAYMMEFGIYDTPRATLDMVYSAYNGGSMDTLPEIPGLILYTPGHVGVYIGNGLVVEAQMEEVGVIMSSLDYRWQAWFMLPGIDYGDSEQTALARGMVFEPDFTETEPEETTDPDETTAKTETTEAATETEKPFISTGDRAKDINRKIASARASSAPTRNYRYLPYGICAAAIAVCIAVAAKKSLNLKKEKNGKKPGNEE